MESQNVQAALPASTELLFWEILPEDVLTFDRLPTFAGGVLSISAQSQTRDKTRRFKSSADRSPVPRWDSREQIGN
jgi:hypothetical protein